MESVKIEQLLDAYFEGNTSLAEEKVLQNYFNTETVAEHLLQYKPIFAGLKAAKAESTSKEFSFSEPKVKSVKMRRYAIAAMLLVAVGIGSFYFSQPNYTHEEREALAAFEKSKNAMLLLSENFNKGTERLTFVGQFGVTKDKIFE
jgi:hypothetical protein